MNCGVMVQDITSLNDQQYLIWVHQLIHSENNLQSNDYLPMHQELSHPFPLGGVVLQLTQKILYNCNLLCTNGQRNSACPCKCVYFLFLSSVSYFGSNITRHSSALLLRNNNIISVILQIIVSCLASASLDTMYSENQFSSCNIKKKHEISACKSVTSSDSEWAFLNMDSFACLNLMVFNTESTITAWSIRQKSHLFFLWCWRVFPFYTTSNNEFEVHC